MRVGWNALVEKWMPQGLEGNEALLGRYYVTAWLVVLPFVLTSIILYSLSGVWGQVVLVVAMGAVGLALLPWYRRTGRLVAATNTSLGAGMVMFGLATLVQTPPDLLNVAFLSVIPLLASLIVGPRRAFRWMLVVMGWGLAMLWLALHGYTLPYPDASPTTSSGLNFVMMVLLTWVFARTYGDFQARALERARAADKAKSAFLAAISHEIRTPMNGVLGMTEVLLQGELTGTQREQLGVMQRSGQLLVALINDLLDLSKAEAGKLTVESAPFDVKAVLQDVEALYGPEAAKKKLRLRLEVEGALPPAVRGDGFRLRQVLNNLVANAVKFTDVGQVTLKATAGSEDRVTFAIEDTGYGIPAETLPQLFSTFQQGELATRRQLGGTGLGLALSQQLVGLMGGHIDVASEPGTGTRFAFTLTLPPAPGAQVKRAPASPVPLMKSRRVLVVDDNAINLAVGVGLVSRAGYVADTAATGREAVELAARNEYAVVLMDLQMPEMDGFEATARIRALSGPQGQVPVVALTASTLPEDMEACRAAGMYEVLTKPVTWAQVEKLLKALARESGSAPSTTPPGGSGQVAAAPAATTSGETSGPAAAGPRDSDD